MGPLWYPADPDLDDIILRPYSDVEVVATCIGFNHAALLLSPDRYACLINREMTTVREPFSLVRASACLILRANASVCA